MSLRSGEKRPGRRLMALQIGARTILAFLNLNRGILRPSPKIMTPRRPSQERTPRYAASSMILALHDPGPSTSKATAIGKEKRRGPALPGLTKRTPLRSSTNGRWE